MDVDDNAFRAEIESLGRPRMAALAAVLGLDPSGTQAAVRARVLGLLEGPPSRRRSNWLRLGYFVATTAGKTLQDELDDERTREFSFSGGMLLVELSQRLGSRAPLDDFLPCSVLPDLAYQVNVDGFYVFALRDAYV
eukprot:SAG31_NODE_16351_length_712_cov_1.637847_1_plen_137_part_00